MNGSVLTYLAVHAGHTRVKLALFDFATQDKLPGLKSHFWIEVGQTFPWDEVSSKLSGVTPDVSLVTGSNQKLVSQLCQAWPDWLPSPMAITRNDMIPIRSLVDVPEKVGADRILNAVAVNQLRDQNSPAIIVDSGTAVTVDVVNSHGEFLGGAILPGVLMGARAMQTFTSTLPLIDGREFLNHAPHAIGRNTEAAMASGLYWGHLGGIKEIVQRAEVELKCKPQLFLTGGALPILEPHLPEATGNPYLSLIGSVLTAKSLEQSET